MAIKERVGSLQLGTSIGDGKKLSPGLSESDTGLLFRLIKKHAKHKTGADYLWREIAGALNFGLGSDSDSLSHYANGDRRLPALSAVRQNREGKEVGVLKLALEKQWLTDDEHAQFDSAIKRSIWRSEEMKRERALDFHNKMRLTILREFENYTGVQLTEKITVRKIRPAAPPEILAAIDDAMESIVGAIDKHSAHIQFETFLRFEADDFSPSEGENWSLEHLEYIISPEYERETLARYEDEQTQEKEKADRYTAMRPITKIKTQKEPTAAKAKTRL